MLAQGLPGDKRERTCFVVFGWVLIDDANFDLTYLAGWR